MVRTGNLLIKHQTHATALLESPERKMLSMPALPVCDLYMEQEVCVCV